MENDKRRDFTPKKIEMSSLYTSQKRTRVQIQEEFLEQKDFLAVWLHLNQYHLSLFFRTKAVLIAFKQKNQTISVERIAIQDQDPRAQV